MYVTNILSNEYCHLSQLHVKYFNVCWVWV